MYRGALAVLATTGNPDSLAQSAHSLRELIEKLPEHLDETVTRLNYNLGNETKNVANQLESAKRSKCRQDGSWAEEIDNPLRSFLGKVEQFLDSFEEHRPKRRTQTEKVLKNLDPTGRPLPGPIQDLRVKEWDHYHSFFQAVSHHRKTVSLEEFNLVAEAFELYLVEKLIPRTFEDYDVIDRLVDEGERDAQS